MRNGTAWVAASEPCQPQCILVSCMHAQKTTVLKHELLPCSLFAAGVVMCIYDFIFAADKF